MRGEWTLGCVNRDTKGQKPKGPQKLTRARVGWNRKKSDAVWCEGNRAAGDENKDKGDDIVVKELGKLLEIYPKS